ncbi:aminoglycoside phosphotransferase family protein [Actinomycetes bacterium KLBMP 9759]
MHSDEVRVAPDVAELLIAEQFPQWAGLPVRRVAAEGTVNAIYRIGDGLVARFPLRDAHRAQLVAEAAAHREFAQVSTVLSPVPVGVGEPGHGHPLPWSVQTWVPGALAADEDPGESTGFARDLAALIRALRAADTRGRRFTGSNRGGDLRDHDPWVQTCFRESGAVLDVAPLAQMWGELRELPRHGADVMSHGDLIPGNVLVDAGRLVGVLDAGGYGPADPALDLVAAWHLLGSGPRAELRRLLACDDVEWARGRAWAFEQAIGLVWYYVESNPRLSEMGRRTLDRLVHEP